MPEIITLANLILDATGMEMNQFARIYGFSYNNLKSWSLPKGSGASRYPNDDQLSKLALVLGEEKSVISALCTREV